MVFFIHSSKMYTSLVFYTLLIQLNRIACTSYAEIIHKYILYGGAYISINLDYYSLIFIHLLLFLIKKIRNREISIYVKKVQLTMFVCEVAYLRECVSKYSFRSHVIDVSCSIKNSYFINQKPTHQLNRRYPTIISYITCSIPLKKKFQSYTFCT